MTLSDLTQLARSCSNDPGSAPASATRYLGQLVLEALADPVIRERLEQLLKRKAS